MANLKEKKKKARGIVSRIWWKTWHSFTVSAPEVPCFMSYFEDEESQYAYVIQTDIIHYHTDTDHDHHHHFLQARK